MEKGERGRGVGQRESGIEREGNKTEIERAGEE